MVYAGSDDYSDHDCRYVEFDMTLSAAPASIIFYQTPGYQIYNEATATGDNSSRLGSMYDGNWGSTVYNIELGSGINQQPTLINADGFYSAGTNTPSRVLRIFNEDGTEIDYSAGIAWEASKVYIVRYELASDSSLVIQACATASIDGETKITSMMFVGNNAPTWGPYVEVMDVVSVTDAFGYKG